MGRVNPFYKQGHAPAGCVAFRVSARISERGCRINRQYPLARHNAPKTFRSLGLQGENYPATSTDGPHRMTRAWDFAQDEFTGL
jgi:hypothetical protein